VRQPCRGARFWDYQCLFKQSQFVAHIPKSLLNAPLCGGCGALRIAKADFMYTCISSPAHSVFQRAKKNEKFIRIRESEDIFTEPCGPDRRNGFTLCPSYATIQLRSTALASLLQYKHVHADLHGVLPESMPTLSHGAPRP